MRRTRQAGWTLIELMITVAIIAVLAGIGVATLQPMIWQGRASEVAANFKSSSTLQESYYNEFGTYISNGWAPVLPGTLTGKNSVSWPAQGSAVISGFEQMGFRPSKEALWYAIRIIACPDVSQAPCSNHACGTTPIHFPQGYQGPGYILEAQGDANGDGVQGQYCATSRSTIPLLIAEDWPGQGG